MSVTLQCEICYKDTPNLTTLAIGAKTEIRKRAHRRRAPAGVTEKPLSENVGKNSVELVTPMSDSSPNKRVQKIPTDRLSSLPDGVLIHVLSFLGVKKAAVTSVLSKRWKFLWSQLPTLAFREESQDTEKILQFVSMVSDTLRIRGRVHMEKLEVSLFFDEGLTLNVHSWLEFVSKCKTKELILQLMTEEDDDLYQLSETIYSIPSLTSLSLRGCFMDTARSIEWKYLTYLHLDHTKLPQHMIQTVFSCCPVLHTLLLQMCWKFDRLEVNSRLLHQLQVHDNDDVWNGPLLVISAPYVHDLDILFHPHARNLQLINMASLVKARVEFTEIWPKTVEIMNTAKGIYEIIQNVKDLYLGCQYFTCISDLVGNGWKIPISRRICLTIATFTDDEHVVTGVIAMLKSSPILEKFVIEGILTMVEIWDQTAIGDLDCDLLHLKTVKLIDFADPDLNGEPMLTVAEAILKRAPVLEEMVVRIRLNELSGYVKVGQSLLTYPRSSPKAVIRLSGGCRHSAFGDGGDFSD